MLEESSVYQDILHKGAQRALQSVAVLQLEERFGKITPTWHRKIERLAIEQIKELCIALLKFQSKGDLSVWFKQQAAKS